MVDFSIKEFDAEMTLNELVASRRSVRAYQSGRTVSREQVEELFRAVQQAPSWKNTETGRYYVALSGEAADKVRACLPAYNQNSSAGAALIVTTFVRNISGHTAGQPDNEAGNAWGAYDLGLQSSYLVLKAREMGLDTLIMGLRDEIALRAALSIPEEESVMAVIALGWRDGEPVIKPRKELTEIVKIL